MSSYIFSNLSGEGTTEALQFFVLDSIKIILILFLMIFLIGIIRTYIPVTKLKKWLSKGSFGVGHLIAALFGAVTPFCSCSSIPIFISFLEAEAPLGVAFSFLITSPMINEYLVVLMFAFFGWKITLVYVLSGILIGVSAGIFLGKLNLERYLEKDLLTRRTKMLKEIEYDGFKKRAAFGFHESVSIVKKLWPWILAGVAVGALIHNYIPQAFVQSIISKGGFLTVPIATALGVPMYGSAAALVPVAVALFEKGVPLGTALAFMMATSALSFPEAIILRRAMRLELILIFFGIVALGIIFTGYAFNIFQAFLV